ncbi:hypothetical protein AB0901_09230 [Streptomyces roseifaciens]
MATVHLAQLEDFIIQGNRDVYTVYWWPGVVGSTSWQRIAGGPIRGNPPEPVLYLEEGQHWNAEPNEIRLNVMWRNLAPTAQTVGHRIMVVTE